MSLFANTMGQVISEYRTLLRRYLDQAERMVKLQRLGLRDADLYQNESALYRTGLLIVKDIRTNMAKENPGYYSYSGVEQFCDHLETYLSNYYLENDQVIHRTQKASRAVLNAVQYLGLPVARLDETVLQKLCEYSATVVTLGSHEQSELLLQALIRQQSASPSFYNRVISHLESLMSARTSEAA